MDVQPATIEQVRIAEDGEMVVISADSSSTVREIQRIDPKLRVRLSTRGRCYIVYYREIHPWGYQDQLVMTCQAYQNNLGTWEGLDNRVVRRLERIDREGRGHYDYAKELEQGRRDREKERKRQADETNGEIAERIAHQLRKDLGERYKGRAFT